MPARYPCANTYVAITGARPITFNSSAGYQRRRAAIEDKEYYFITGRYKARSRITLDAAPLSFLSIIAAMAKILARDIIHAAAARRCFMPVPGAITKTKHIRFRCYRLH